MDSSGAVVELLDTAGGEKCVACIEGCLVDGRSRSNRLLALIECHQEHGLLVYRCRTTPVVSPEDLFLEKVIPVKGDFQCIVETGDSYSLAADVPISIKTTVDNLLFEFPFGHKTTSFVNVVKHSMGSFIQRISRGLGANFSWLEKYQRQSEENQSSSSFENSGLDFGLDDDFDPRGQESTPCKTAAVAHTNYSSTAAQPSEWPWGHIITPKNDGNTPVAFAEVGFDDNFHHQSGSQGFEDNFADTLNFHQDVVDKETAESSPRPRGLDIDQGSSGPRGLDSDDGSSPSKMNESNSLGDSEPLSPTLAKPIGTRDSMVKIYMARREDEFTFLKPFRLFVGTYNVNGQLPAGDLSSWLAPPGRDPPDIYVLGFQELDLSKEAFLFNDSPREDLWYRAVTESLPKGAGYIKVKLVRLVGMMMIIYIQDRHKRFLENISADTVGTGIMGKMGNKGGVGVRLVFHTTSFCFVNSHLAAHVEEYERRNQDYADICSRMSFSTDQPPSLHIAQHDIVIWLGDLNYRINDVPADKIKSLSEIENYNYEELIHHDQLKQQMNSRRVFADYMEGATNFQPTYKYDTGSDSWDSSEKNRAPAYTDRILWKPKPNIRQLSYCSDMKLKISDHKPVYSFFEVDVKVIDEKKYKKVYEEVIRELDRLENEFLPQVKLSKIEFQFDSVKFMEEQRQSFQVLNNGQVPVQFEFIKKLDESSYSKPWLRVEPSCAFIMPGDMVEVSVVVLVSKTSAAALNSGDDNLDDILVLHLDGGKDFFILVGGSYVPSCFGASIEALVRMHGPIREIAVEQLKKLEKNPEELALSPDTEFQAFDIPKEIWMLVDHLFRNGIKTKELFSVEGLHKEVIKIRNCLDTGLPEEVPGGVHSVAEALLIFIASLRVSVIPSDCYQKCLEASSSFPLCKQVLSQIPRSHLNVFKYLTAFLRELLINSEENDLDKNTLAALFGDLFLREPSGQVSYVSRKSRAQQVVSQKKAAFICHFLEKEFDE